VSVDGNDVLVVRKAVHEAVERARTDRQPSLLDIKSYRLKGHSVVDPDRYRPDDYLKEIRAQDPVLRFADRLGQAGILDESELDDIEQEVEREVDAAVEFADESREPEPQRLFEFSYASAVPNQPDWLPGHEPWVAR
jgi:pyruvate dehydrogenase E1 component alpha subunit